MTTLFASNNVADWVGGFVSDTANASAYDSTRVPYYLKGLDDQRSDLAGPHSAPSGTTVWYHFRYFAAGIAPTSSEDGHVCTISDINGLFLFRLDMLNGQLTNAISGDGITFTNGTYAGNFGAFITEIDIKVDVTAGAVTTELYVNQVLHTSGTMAVGNTNSLDVARNFAFDFTDVGFGDGSVFMAVSEFLVSETDTRNARVNLLQPTTVGNYAQWDGNVVDLSDSDASTGMSTGVSNERQSVNIGAYAGGATIASVIAVSRMSRSELGPVEALSFLRKGAVNYDGSIKIIGLTPTFIVEEWLLDPADSLTWTASDLSGLELGVKSIGLAAPAFIEAGAMIISSGVTSVAVPYPADIEADDLLLMNIMARSAVTTPSGWTLIGTQLVFDGTDNQSVHLFSKTATGVETGTLSVVQASSNRQLGQMCSIRSSTGTPVVTIDTQGDHNGVGTALPMGSLTGVVDFTLGVVCLTNNFAITSGTTQLDPDAGYSSINPGDITSKRLSWAWIDVDNVFSDASVAWTTDVADGHLAYMHLLINNP